MNKNQSNNTNCLKSAHCPCKKCWLKRKRLKKAPKKVTCTPEYCPSPCPVPICPPDPCRPKQIVCLNQCERFKQFCNGKSKNYFCNPGHLTFFGVVQIKNKSSCCDLKVTIVDGCATCTFCVGPHQTVTRIVEQLKSINIIACGPDPCIKSEGEINLQLQYKIDCG